MLKKIPYCITNFKELITEGNAYVDKTNFIEILENATKCNAFFRPRKFGKSLLISTLYYYYDYKYATEFDDLFGCTYIGAHPTPLRNKYAVIRFNFSGINSSDPKKVYEEFTTNIMLAIATFFVENKITLNKPIERLSPAHVLRQFFNEIMAFEHQLYILIDEYDHFSNNMLGLHTDAFNDMVSTEGFVRCFFEEVKKGRDEGLVQQIFLSGVCPITLDSLTSGFNISYDLTQMPYFHDVAGFTRNDVEWLIDSTLSLKGIKNEDILEQMAALYNGYDFCGNAINKIFNSDLVLYYLKSLSSIGKPPEILMDKNVISDYFKLQALVSLDLGEMNNSSFTQVEASKSLRTDAILSIMRGEPQHARLTQAFELAKFTHNDFLSLLFYMGYLTIESRIGANVNLVLPNEVIKGIFYDYFTNVYLYPTTGIDNRACVEAMEEIATKGRNGLFIKYISDFLGLTSDRIYLNFSEKHFQFLGYMIASGYTGFKATMEKDVGYGHVDLALLPNETPVKYYAFEELKYIKAGDLNPKSLEGQSLEDHRMGLIIAKWDEGLTELKKYSQNPEFASLQSEGRLKKWITIFSTHRCLVNQEIDVEDNSIQMQLCDFTWWFPPKISSTSIKTTKRLAKISRKASAEERKKSSIAPKTPSSN
ncbi:MAG: ATP-binding protein [Clostridiales bacterium]|nr:ATP-binding protein [Clostridiales bacterium]